MQEHQIIEFYKERNFSDKISATIEFIRQNFKNLTKIVLIIFGPVSIILGLIFGLLMINIPKLTNSDFVSDETAMSFMGAFFLFYFLFIVVAGILYALFTSMIYNYIKLYNERQSTEIELKEVWKIAWKDVPKIIGYFIVAGFLTMLGVLAFFVGAIYLGIVLSLGVSAMIYENIGVFEAMSRCFKLIKEKWFSTLGLLIVIGIMQYAIQFVFSIPYYAFNLGSTFLSWQNPDNMLLEGLSTGQIAIFIIGMTLIMLGSFFSYLLPNVAISYQYSNLVEKQESRGLMQKIDSIEDNSEKDNSYL